MSISRAVPMRALAVASLLAGLVSLPALPQSGNPSASIPQTSVQPAKARYRPGQMPAQESRYYALIWGIDSPSVKLLESGELVRFTYYVVDPLKAKMLNEKTSQPFLVDPQAGVKLVVPQLEQVGMLRQSSTPQAGKSYWMAFSNKGGVVKRGDHVDIVIGTFRAEGLVVE